MEPALGIALILGPRAIIPRPKPVPRLPIPDRLTKVARIEPGAKQDLPKPELILQPASRPQRLPVESRGAQGRGLDGYRLGAGRLELGHYY
jgi:hypothetical protein